MRSLHSWGLALAVCFSAGVAVAGDYSRAITHVTTRSPEQALAVLTSYSQTCDSGCKYRSPDVREVIRLSHGKTDTSWYTWTWISTTFKDTKYFTHVTRLDKPDGTIVLVLRLLSKGDEGLIAELTRASGKESQPAFESGKTIFSLRRLEDGKTRFVQDASLKASGLIDVFSDKIRAGIEAGMRANIDNIERASGARDGGEKK